MSAPLSLLARLYDAILFAGGAAAGLAVAAIALLTTGDVVLRAFGSGAFTWTFDIAEYALFALTFLGAPWVLAQGAHVRVDFLVTSLPARAGQALEIAVDLIGLAICVALFWYALEAASDAHAMGSRLFKTLVVAEWWLLGLIPVSAALLAIEFVRRIVRTFATGAPVPEVGLLERRL